jgi:hypothetical protein
MFPFSLFAFLSSLCLGSLFLFVLSPHSTFLFAQYLLAGKTPILGQRYNFITPNRLAPFFIAKPRCDNTEADR